MQKRTISVLLVEDDPIACGLFHAQLASDFTTRFDAVAVDTLAQALERLREQRFDVIVLDLILPDARGLAALDRLREEAGHLPVVLMTGLDDEELAVEALQHGAQDYLVKGDLTGRLISRSLRHAIERQRLIEALHSLSLLDDLTGLYNRRGFTTLAGHQLKAAWRHRRGIAVISVEISESRLRRRSPEERTSEIRRVGETLRDTFRGSDLIARSSDTGFLVLAQESQRQGAESALKRLEERLADDDAPEPAVRVRLDWAESGTLTTVEDLASRLQAGEPRSLAGGHEAALEPRPDGRPS